LYKETLPSPTHKVLAFYVTRGHERPLLHPIHLIIYQPSANLTLFNLNYRKPLLFKYRLSNKQLPHVTISNVLEIVFITQQISREHFNLLNLLSCNFNNFVTSAKDSGPGSLVGVATGYGLNGPGTQTRWGRDFPHLSRPAVGPTQLSCTMGTGSFSGVNNGRGVTLIPHSLLVPLVMKE